MGVLNVDDKSSSKEDKMETFFLVRMYSTYGTIGIPTADGRLASSDGVTTTERDP